MSLARASTSNVNFAAQMSSKGISYTPPWVKFGPGRGVSSKTCPVRNWVIRDFKHIPMSWVRARLKGIITYGLTPYLNSRRLKIHPHEFSSNHHRKTCSQRIWILGIKNTPPWIELDRAEQHHQRHVHSVVEFSGRWHTSPRVQLVPGWRAL